jgi:Tc toxin complex TcA C-terminal TcB-binding domain
MLSGIASYKATSAATLGRFDRSSDDAQLQERSTLKELARIDQEIEAAKLRRDIAASDLDVHDVQIENAEKVSQTMTDQYTNVELYQWTANEITQVYYRAYKLAFDTARKAERCYQHELGSPESFLAFGYWDSRKKGLQSANKLLHDIKRMEVRYFDANEREYELTKHVSLRRLDPLALTRLQTTGVCDFEVPEALFDSDHPGHYVRRARSVAVSIPCVAGPYASVSARLTQVANRYRSSTAKASGAGTPKEEYEEATGNDVRFVYNVGAAQSVATSSAQNDAGLFELDFRDDRYLPFEGTGAVGSWRLELPAELRQFDYATISDAILHIRYTAREGGSSLRTLAVASLAEKIQEIAQDLAKTGLHVVCDLRRDDSNAWHALKSTGSATVTIGADRLPYFAQSLAPTLGPVTLLARVAGDPAAYTVAVDDANVALNFSSDFGLNLNDVAGPALGVPFTLTVAPGDTAALDDLSLVAKVDFP